MRALLKKKRLLCLCNFLRFFQPCVRGFLWTNGVGGYVDQLVYWRREIAQLRQFQFLPLHFWVKPWSFCVLAAQAVTRYIASSSKLLRRSNGAKNINVSFLDEVVCVTSRWSRRNSFNLRQLFNQGSVDIQDTITTLLNLWNFGISDELLISSAKWDNFMG